ncbi:LptA/OstA family protein [Petrotoga sp. 9PWA.NaAc.5.4]|uniref:LptA/OstA family protein n=1 Tax=Petrotoga sp. 9PWA.NaAc.5.4 TaxID=1434328 RepID=UPI000CB6FCD3|nr:LptA/OstA family protein [Petrotoga sp. 9PWA.NaAc.5.4]PNR94150.1 hypothetical protein X924_06940 [Petrotoga sp. 9PWA.NaAc.5.4]
MKKSLILLLSFFLINILLFSATINVRAGNVRGGENQYILTDNVLIQKGDLSITTNHATITLINNEWRNVKTNEVSIKSESFESKALLMDFDLQMEKGLLKGEVISKILLEDSTIEIICDEMQFDNINKIYEGNSNNLVTITKSDYFIYSKKFRYEEEKNLLNLMEEVHIINKAKKIDMKSEKATFDTITEEIEATTVDLTLEVGD